MVNEEKINKGTYCLIILVDNNCNIKIGAKGTKSFKKGCYIYVGSALGSLSKRIERHISNNKKKHWHADYLLLNKHTKIIQVIYTHSSKKIECKISSYINDSVNDYIEDFGCSDCKCESHLYYFDTLYNAEKIAVEAFENNNCIPYCWIKK